MPPPYKNPRKDPYVKTSLSLIAAVMALALPALAQERAATGPMDTQMTWTALSTMISSVGTKVDGANKRMDQLVICSKKGMLYAPGDAASDGQGCKASTAAPTLASCYQRAGTFGTHVTCNSGEVVTKVCSSGGDPDCIAPAGAIYSGGQTAGNDWQGPRTPVTLTAPRSAFTVTTCCKLK